MTKNEFVDKLSIALTGKVSDALVKENITYYEEYIESQISMGKSEEEVMEMLGDPRLIARTIVQTNGTSADSAEDASYRDGSDNGYYNNGNYSGGTYSNGNYNNGTYSGSGYTDSRNEVKVRRLPGWLWAVIAIIIVIVVLNVVFSLISFLLPLILPILLVVFLVKLFRDWLN